MIKALPGLVDRCEASFCKLGKRESIVELIEVYERQCIPLDGGSSVDVNVQH